MAARAKRNKALVLKLGGRKTKTPVAASISVAVVCLGDLRTDMAFGTTLFREERYFLVLEICLDIMIDR